MTGRQFYSILSSPKFSRIICNAFSNDQLNCEAGRIKYINVEIVAHSRNYCI